MNNPFDDIMALLEKVGPPPAFPLTRPLVWTHDAIKQGALLIDTSEGTKVQLEDLNRRYNIDATETVYIHPLDWEKLRPMLDSIHITYFEGKMVFS